MPPISSDTANQSGVVHQNTGMTSPSVHRPLMPCIDEVLHPSGSRISADINQALTLCASKAVLSSGVLVNRTEVLTIPKDNMTVHEELKQDCPLSGLRDSISVIEVVRPENEKGYETQMDLARLKKRFHLHMRAYYEDDPLMRAIGSTVIHDPEEPVLYTKKERSEDVKTLSHDRNTEENQSRDLVRTGGDKGKQVARKSEVPVYPEEYNTLWNERLKEMGETTHSLSRGRIIDKLEDVPEDYHFADPLIETLANHKGDGIIEDERIDDLGYITEASNTYTDAILSDNRSSRRAAHHQNMLRKRSSRKYGVFTDTEDVEESDEELDEVADIISELDIK
ncbi:uncharacterized protein L199_006338 [Kwoniella botswanensis]|uniref:uncharacterized protein n=1 Tax=Kwoniella botswanensis TaxID=1268659 RepID=UPI00315DC0F8